MSPAEAAGRSRRAAAHRVDAVYFHVAPPLWRATWYPDLAKRLVTDPLARPTGFLRAASAAVLRDQLPSEAEALVARADRVLEGHVQFFGYPEVSVAPDPSHDADPFSGRAWPSRHGKRIDYRRNTAGDPKWIWELNRSQNLPVLAAAWLLTGNNAYAEAASARMISWIERHPPGRGIAWSNGFEAGIRAISLATTMDALRGSEFLSSDPLEKALRSLWQHARWIERDPATGSSANNHRIGELVGLAAIGCLAPELSEAKRWRDEALGRLCREVERQIRSDGTSAEQSFAYHLFVVDLLLVVISLLDATGGSIPTPLETAIERSGDALWSQLGEGEPAPSYGDADDGRALVLDAHGLRDPHGVAAGIAARFGHAKAARAAGGVDAAACWLFGAEGVARFEAVEPADWPGNITLPDTGLTILRAGRCRAIFDHGPHGYLSIAAHGHADALRLEVSLGPAELVVDPGVGSYFGQPRLRAFFRGTGAHATVVVDGLDSSTAGGPFLWTRCAETRVVFADPANGLVVAEHDGYERLSDPATHRRTVALADDSILVVDRLESRGRHRYSQAWPLHPALELKEESSRRVVAHGDEAGVILAFSASQPLALNAVRGEVDPPAGWWSERLESVTPSWRVGADVNSAGVVEIATWIVPFQGSSVPETEVGLDVSPERTRVRLAGERGTQVVEIASNGRAVAVRRNLAVA